MKPNAGHQALPGAGATQERTLAAVGCTPWFGGDSISGGQIPRSLLRLLGAVIVARMSEYIHQSHNVSVLMYHLVCPAKYRRVVFDARVDTVLKEVCLDIAKR